jgi:hypothetical protein
VAGPSESILLTIPVKRLLADLETLGADGGQATLRDLLPVETAGESFLRHAVLAHLAGANGDAPPAFQHLGIKVENAADNSPESANSLDNLEEGPIAQVSSGKVKVGKHE